MNDRLQGLAGAMAKWTTPGSPARSMAVASPYRPRKKRNGATPEALVLRAVCDYLRAKKIFFWRQNVGAIRTDHGFMRFGSAGQPDVMAIASGKFYAIEAKSSVGRQSEEQKAWQERCERAGGVYILARGKEDLEMAGI